MNQLDRIRQAEHRFCEAVGLKVNPKTYDGRYCAECVVGQLIIADHLLKTFLFVPDEPYAGKVEEASETVFLKPNAPSFEDFVMTEDMKRWGMDKEQTYVMVWRASTHDLIDAVASHYDVDYEKVDAIYYEVADDPYWDNLEAAKAEVIAAYMECD